MSLLDIHAGLTFSAIAPYIGLEPTAKHTVAAKCPYCGAHEWAIYQDSRNLEQWHYCYQCTAQGNILAMAAERLGMEMDEAMQYLADQLNYTLTFDDMKAYRESQDLAARLMEFWKHARTGMQQMSPAHAQLIQQLGWQCTSPMSLERRMAGPGQLYGVVHPSIAQDYNWTRFFLRNGSVAVVPYYKTPTQIGSFACYVGNREIFVGAMARGARSLKIGEVGFAGLQFLWRSQSDTVVVTSMVSNMIQLQVHNFSSSDLPLPLISWRQSATPSPQKQWATLAGRQVVIWERAPTAAVLHQAILSNAQLSFIGPDITRQKSQEVAGPRWRAWIHHDPSIDIWRRVVRSARPYAQALENWARTASPTEQAQLLRDAEQYTAAVASLVRSVIAPKTCAQIGRRINVATKGQGGTNGSNGHTVIVEQDDKWYNLAGHVRLPAIVRVKYIIVRPGGAKEYVGYLKADGREIEFRVPSSKASMAWLRDFGMANGVFMQTDFFTNIFRDKKTESFDPFDAACRFEEPEIVPGLERIGWDGAGFQFRLAHLADGKFSQNPEFKLPDDAPGPRKAYCRMRDEVKEALQKEGPEMEVTWATALALCAQITAPAVHLQPLGICLNRSGADAFIQTLYHRFELRKGDYTQWPHRWPRRLDRWELTRTRDETGFFVVPFSLDVHPTATDLLVVDVRDKTLEPRKLTHSADKILLNYLRHFSTQTHETPRNWPLWVEYTARQMQQAFDFVTTEAIKNSPQRLTVR